MRSSRSRFRATITTSCRSAASNRVNSRPMPPDAPVIRAVRRVAMLGSELPRVPVSASADIAITSRPPHEPWLMARMFPSVSLNHAASLQPPRASFAQSADHHLCRFRAREILLTGDEVAVANRESAPEPGPNIVRAEAFHLVLDSPRHHVLAAREKIHRPDRVV